MKTDSRLAWWSMSLMAVSLFHATATFVPGHEVVVAGIAAMCSQLGAALAVRAWRKHEVGLVFLALVAFVWLVGTLPLIGYLTS